eukprot:TRINITY_DN14649_c0_g1_i1.p1 TRINITY_DN14649_c0_g1~~TRINITY_DN14649_c0_g1_i1.p1  ORF type:complete len:140 (+),score=11.34 TRINITY_DN14649_c0_g1_i1:31-450(+)
MEKHPTSRRQRSHDSGHDRNGQLTWSSKQLFYKNKTNLAHCFVSVLKKYIKAYNIDMESKTPLFLSVVDFDRVITSETISKRTSIRMTKAGIDLEYTSHALQGAVANYLLKQGVPLERVLNWQMDLSGSFPLLLLRHHG